MIDSVFVYGTLKQGQCRESLWPCAAKTIQPAWAFGTLYGRKDYPAMTIGTDRVRGEHRAFAVEELPIVLDRLDSIEGANQHGCDDLYRRVCVDVFDLNGNRLGQAYGYHYATDPQRDGFQKIDATNENGFVIWP
ncbi:AIG2-like family protein [Planctomycetes bacterium CA13]|uniref:AIG2-like family protein n=1 Tax=Novipirellula herctigrandis TaxID=2527986 RepID=A0A5C5Z9Y3_9BACT|nr:AIG2-like family protein [Planctomycetes bacterium CA13]